MAETENYSLSLTDDASTPFKTWREELNGTTNSNMIKIDGALAEKANSSISINATLLASAWAGTTAPYTQTISVDGLSADGNGTIHVAQGTTLAQREAARLALLCVLSQDEGTLTIGADSDDLPEIDIPVTIILTY